VGAHLELWGVPASKITELDWWETTNLKTDLTITATPARHFSGRGLNRNESFWSSFVLKTKTETLFLGGDSGYDTHFAEIGKKYGPFDYAILENGQYNKAWQAIHTLPSETAQAATDLGAKKLLPVHWSKFTLALHPWFEPMEALVQAAEKHSFEIVNPRLGETSVLKDLTLQTWWK
ncbi:MAG: MBL fold metallo-hydrolase, partial [Flexibacteraceae bacterium]